MSQSATSMADKDVVIFDFDGTLADTVPAITATAREVLLGHGLTDETMGDLTRIVGPPFPQAFSSVYGFSEAEAAQITKEYRVRYVKLGLAAWPLFDGISELLDKLRAQGRRVAIASSKLTRTVERALADNGATDLFDLVLGKADDADQDKAETIAQVLCALDVSADQAVMVGDRHHDVRAARACGVPCVGVTYGGASVPGELEEAGASVVVGSVDELEDVLLGS